MPHTPPNKIDWTPGMISFLRDNFEAMPITELAKSKEINLKVYTVRLKCYELGLKKMDLEYWTDAQVKFLKESYRHIGDKELAEIFNDVWPKNKRWTLKHIEKKRLYLKLKRTPKQLKAIRERNKLYGCWAVGSKHSWITRGAKPLGTVYLWGKNRAPYYYIKVASGVFMYHRWLWEQIHGPVPSGHVIRFKDGNPLNIGIGNLEMISMAENGIRNSKMRLDYPEELKQLIKLNNKLKNTINASVRKETTNHA